MKKVYGYIRVSTVKQGNGVSLQEQKEAIIRYAEKHQLEIIEWFEEQETAAKQGRPLFSKMMKLMQSGKAAGVIIHKIDRSARNLKDWAALGDLIDQGVDVHFAHESLDLETRGGRLAADIQAVIASDYIRNLRDEAMKGLYGRLKQGIYPFGAPIGYINNGGGKLKTVDPIQGPLVKKAFQLYSSGKYSLDSLSEAVGELGLRNSVGSVLSVTTMSKILNNTFYVGLLKVKGKTFQGGHQPLISVALFNQVQDILNGKTNSKFIKHDFLFRRLAKCTHCGYSLTGEKQKGHVYYRCHTKKCPTKGIREENIEKNLIQTFGQIQLHPLESQILNEMLEEAQNNWSKSQNGIEESLRMQQSQVSLKLERLTDAYIESTIEKDLFEAKKERLLVELQGLRHKMGQLSGQKEAIFKKAKNFLELAKSIKNAYLIGIAEEKRKVLKIVTSNLQIQAKKPMISMKSPFHEIANRLNFASSGLNHNTPRICTVEYDTNNNFLPVVVDNPELRERMRNILNLILSHFELQGGGDDEEDQGLLP